MLFQIILFVTRVIDNNVCNALPAEIPI